MNFASVRLRRWLTLKPGRAMTDPHDIASEMVACPGWRFSLPGMLLRWPNGSADRVTEYTIAVSPGGLPDLTDPATLGCLEHGLLAPAGAWVERVQTVTHRVAYIARTADGTIAAGPVPLLEHYRDNLPAALLDGLRAVAS